MLEGAEKVLNIYTCYRAELKLGYFFHAPFKFELDNPDFGLPLNLLFFLKTCPLRVWAGKLLIKMARES